MHIIYIFLLVYTVRTMF